MPTAKELMRAGELYPGADPELNWELDQRQAMLATLNAIPPNRAKERQAALEELIAEIGEDTFIRSPFYCDYGDGIRIGARAFINFNCTMLDGAPITIGDECLIASGVQLITATHPIDPVPRRAAWEQALPITIGDGVWLGAGAIVCPGVTIGANTVVGAGAIVTKDLPAGVVTYGNPARVAREIGDGDRLDLQNS
ncbi:MAG TPA: sugar O-acetyltransferase [Solirubrobacterales bacterium]|nr:sugar O-acetyltransferase [Solirubrobacterales bacterium]